ncbi:MAG: hypothetical protein C4527_25745, partial [Candidatus Omnitrophota bacterium]
EGRPIQCGITGRFDAEWAADLARNHRPIWNGICNLTNFLDEARPDRERLRLIAQALAGTALAGNVGQAVSLSGMTTTPAEQAALRKLVADEIQDLVQRKGMLHRDIAVLYRCNFQSRMPEETFSTRKIPYHIENGMKFYSRKEVKNLLDYLRLIQNPYYEQGNEALKQIYNVTNRRLSFCFTGMKMSLSTIDIDHRC